MIKNYLLVATRNFKRNKLYVLLNLIGLGFGIACCIVAYINWESDSQFDRNHKNAEDIYKINSFRNIEGKNIEYGLAPLALASTAQGQISGISETASLIVKREVFKKDNEVWYRQVGYVSDSFFSMFTFDVLQGSLKSFNGSNVIITESTAIKYFQDYKNVIGEQMQLSVADGQLYDFIVSAVIADPPTNSSFMMEMFINIAEIEKVHSIDLNDWSELGHAFFIRTEDQQKMADVLNELNHFSKKFNEKRSDWQIDKFNLVPFYKMAHYGRKTRGNYLSLANPEGSVLVPMLMSILILLIGCFNFTNTSIALGEKRLKEFGIRKALGGQRIQLIFQIIWENTILCILALLFGMLLAEVLVPAYNQMGPWVNNILNYQDNLPLVGFLIALVAFIVLATSIYPAVYISRFDAIQIMKGNIIFKNSNWLTRSLIVLQLSISLSTLIQGAGYIENSLYQDQFDLGFYKDGVISIPIKDSGTFTQFRQRLTLNPSIQSLSGSKDHLGVAYRNEMLEIGSEKRGVITYNVGDNYLETNGLKITEGRFFHANSADINNSIIVNETLIRDWLLTNPIGQNVRVGDQKYVIIGVIKDFYPLGLWIGQEQKPTIFLQSNPDSYAYMTAKVDANSILDINDQIKHEWQQMFPFQPYEGSVENHSIMLSRLLNKNMVVLNIVLAIMALLLSAIGLFNMVSMDVLRMRKSIGVRKVLGASLKHVIINMTKVTILIVSVSMIIGAVQGYFLTGLVLDLMYSFHSSPSLLNIFLVSLLVLMILVGVLTTKVIQAAKENPINALRLE